MLEISRNDEGVINLEGRFDASQVQAAKAVLDTIGESCILDFGALTYISSAGLGLLFATQKRLVDTGNALRLINLTPHIREIFQIAGFDHIFEID